MLTNIYLIYLLINSSTTTLSFAHHPVKTDNKMKLLGWMHRKFRQNSSETFKDFSIGQPSLDDQHHYPRPHYGTSPFWQGPRDNCKKSFTGLETAIVEDYEEEESAVADSEIFHGFLAIGTLGSDPDIIGPSTPTFSISIENITGKETEATENELKLINDELEKVLGGEAKENGFSDSSSRNSHASTGRNSHVSTGRNSHASTGRSSHCSTITLSGKSNEGLEINGNGTSVCPLQGYLFGSAVELSETSTAAKKEHRTSLGELLQKSVIGEEEKRTEKEGDKSAVQLMKKILKKKVSNVSSRSSAATADSASAERKHPKILQMFHRKVHPERQSSTSLQKFDKPRKIEKKTDMTYDAEHNNGTHMLQDDDIVIFPEKGFLKESTRHYNIPFNPPHFTPYGSSSNGITEHWIKTDADYLVLEL